MSKLTKKIIKSKMPKDFKVSNHSGLPLNKGWYCLLFDEKNDYWVLRTSYNEPALDILRTHFDVKKIDNFWNHWDNFSIKEKVI